MDEYTVEIHDRKKKLVDNKVIASMIDKTEKEGKARGSATERQTNVVQRRSRNTKYSISNLTKKIATL